MPYFVPASINAKLPPHAEAIEDDPTELEEYGGGGGGGGGGSIKQWSGVSKQNLLVIFFNDSLTINLLLENTVQHHTYHNK